MRKKGLLAAVILMAAFLLTGCCDHEWEPATCGVPETCTKCGETKGEPTGEHTWKNATCTEPETCSVCGATEGEALGHNWEDATCTEPKTCSRCGEIEGKALGHDWEDATCTEPKTCSRCGETEGEALGHTVEEWNAAKEATCTEEGQKTGKCTVCGKTIDQKIEKTEHTPGEWQVTKAAEWNAAGERTRSCTVCGTVLETEEYELSDAEKESIFKSSCTEYTYDQIARDPDAYLLEHAVYTGEVIQVMEGDDSTSYRINITPTSYGGYTDTIYVECDSHILEGKSRILEDDIVRVWGYNFSTISYTTVLGAKMTIPAVYAEYIEIVG